MLVFRCETLCDPAVRSAYFKIVQAAQAVGIAMGMVREMLHTADGGLPAADGSVPMPNASAAAAFARANRQPAGERPADS